MLIKGQPRELRAVRKPKVFGKVCVTQSFEAPRVGRIRAGEVGTITAVRGDEVQIDFGRTFDVTFDRPSLRTYTKPFAWVALAAKPGREVATLYRWN